MSIIKHFLYYMHKFNEAPIKIFLFEVDSYLIKRIKHVLDNVPCKFLQQKQYNSFSKCVEYK